MPPSADAAAPGPDPGEAVTAAADSSGEEPAAHGRGDDRGGGTHTAGEEVATLCRLMTAAADMHGVPHDFFIRLIWKESRFDPGAVSPVGAQGIAQFMPGTARLRGLADPFDREEALFASAHFLADLQARFGSWGLAAAGYNGGPNRVPPFVAGEGTLPAETRDYVFSITGRTAEYWARRARRASAPPEPGEALAPSAADPEEGAPPRPVLAMEALAERLAVPAVEGDLRSAGEAASIVLWSADGQGLPDTGLHLAAASAVAVPLPRPDYEPPRVDCPQLVARLGRSRSIAVPSGMGTGWTRWGAQVAGHPRRAAALRHYEELRARLPADLVRRGPTIVVRRFAARGRLPIHSVMFAAAGQAEARAMCRRIAAALAPCVVVRNP